MKLENQLVCKELSKKLKELGVKQESLHYWYMHKLYGKDKDYSDSLCLAGMFDFSTYPEKWWNRYSAFTVAELGEMLPVQFDDFGWADLKISKCKATWDIAYVHYHFNDNNHLVEISYQVEIREKALADAMAKMLIWLIENKHIKL